MPTTVARRKFRSLVAHSERINSGHFGRSRELISNVKPVFGRSESHVDHLRFHRQHEHLSKTFGSDLFGLKAEAFARFFGTPVFLGVQTIIVAMWIAANFLGLAHFDVYPFTSTH